jgi:hypothetical protein
VGNSLASVDDSDSSRLLSGWEIVVQNFDSVSFCITEHELKKETSNIAQCFNIKLRLRFLPMAFDWPEKNGNSFNFP